MAHRAGRLGIPRRMLGAVLEAAVWLQARLTRIGKPSPEPRSILVLRNNDFGDLLVTTPMFAAIRRRYPNARICVAVGRWNTATLENNPNVDETIVLNAPWYNHFVPNRSIAAALRFIFGSEQVRQLRERAFDAYIDVVGSHFGAMLGLRARIPRRIAPRGYAGGHSALTDSIDFTPSERVPRANLRLAELLGATELPPPRPQLFLTSAEADRAEQRWVELGAARPTKRIVVGPGVGSPGRSWPIEHYAALVARLTARGDIRVIVVGGPKDADIGRQITANNPAARNACGEFSLRDTFAAVAACDLVVCNASMLSHVSAAFSRPTIVLLGPKYPSAQAESRLWGYDTCHFLGREGDSGHMATVDEAYSVVGSMLRDPR